MAERFTDEPASSDSEALANLVSVYKRLEASTVLRIGQQLIDSQSEDDLLQSTIAIILEKEKWKEIRSTLGLYRYARRAMINEAITLRERGQKGESLDAASELGYEILAWLALSPAEKFEIAEEDEATIEWVKSEFPGDMEVHDLLDCILEGYKRRELPKQLKMEGRKVTELLRKLKRRRKITELRDRARKRRDSDKDN